MAEKARLGLYLVDEDIKRQIKVAAAKRRMTVTDYCAQAIEERLIQDGERSLDESRFRNRDDLRTFMERMDQLRAYIGPVGVPTTDLIKEGRRR